MYCKKCGKFVKGESDLCENCRQAPTYAPTTVIPPQPVNNGFKKALASTIVSCCSFLLLLLGCALCLVSSAGRAVAFFFSGPLTTLCTVLGVIFLLAAVTGSILSLIWGIRSIKKYAELKRAGYQKPTATLVLGICGTVIAGFDLFYTLIFWLVLLVFITALRFYIGF